MRDVPRQDTQPERHAQLLLCMFKPFFRMIDLRQVQDKSWTDALLRTDASNGWDPRSATMRMNIEGMLRQRHAADEEIARKREQARLRRAEGDTTGNGLPDVDDTLFSAAYDDDTVGTNVMPPGRHDHSVIAYVNAAKDRCLDAGFSRNDNNVPRPRTLLSGRTQEQVNNDASKVTQGPDAATATAALKKQKKAIKTLEDNSVAANEDPSDNLPVNNVSHQFNMAELDPYITQMRTHSQRGLSPTAIADLDQLRTTTNAIVAASDVGRTYPQQHDAVLRIADELGLNRQQRLAFFIFGNAWTNRQAIPTENTLRLVVSGGAGSGKSYVLKAMKALVDCPAFDSVSPPGKIVTVAFQGGSYDSHT